MRNTSQKRALQNYRARLGQRGLARFEVLGLDVDRDLIRALARRLALNDAEAKRLRTDVGRSLVGGQPRRGHILEALRRSPLVGAELDTTRQAGRGRDVEL